MPGYNRVQDQIPFGSGTKSLDLGPNRIWIRDQISCVCECDIVHGCGCVSVTVYMGVESRTQRIKVRDQIIFGSRTKSYLGSGPNLMCVCECDSVPCCECVSVNMQGGVKVCRGVRV